jgi:hypothetical protein
MAGSRHWQKYIFPAICAERLVLSRPASAITAFLSLRPTTARYMAAIIFGPAAQNDCHKVDK